MESGREWGREIGGGGEIERSGGSEREYRERNRGKMNLCVRDSFFYQGDVFNYYYWVRSDFGYILFSR